MKLSSRLLGAFCAASLLLATGLKAQLQSFSGYDAYTLGPADDSSSDPVSLGFTATLWGHHYSQVWVNNNGNVTFDGAFDDPLTSFVPTGLSSLGRVIVAPFFSDVDTTAPESGLVTFGTGLLGGRAAFAANWFNVEPFFELPVFNSFQMILVDRSDTGAGNFDISFNYGSIAWEGGQATGSDEFGLGGIAARVGLSDGTDAHTLELPGSGVNGALLDSNLFTGLRYSNPGVDFAVRNGMAVPVPEPSSYALAAGTLLAALAAARRLRFSRRR